ncbi:unnamed protein product, partial [Choristocarpus tenellus]
MGEGNGATLVLEEAEDLLAAIIDISATLTAVLCLCQPPPTGDGNGGTGVGWGPGMLGPLALRAQDVGGVIAPESFSAALALTFEATLPELEGVLQA